MDLEMAVVEGLREGTWRMTPKFQSGRLGQSWQHGEDEGQMQRQGRMLVGDVSRRVPSGQSRGVGVSQSS